MDLKRSCKWFSTINLLECWLIDGLEVSRSKYKWKGSRGRSYVIWRIKRRCSRRWNPLICSKIREKWKSSTWVGFGVINRVKRGQWKWFEFIERWLKLRNGSICSVWYYRVKWRKESRIIVKRYCLRPSITRVRSSAHGKLSQIRQTTKIHLSFTYES